MPNGVKCGSPGLKGKHYCYFHTRLHDNLALQRSGKEQPLQFSPLEDRAAIQIAVGQVLNAMASNRIEPRNATAYLYGLQIASQNVDNDLTVLPTDAVQSFTRTADGEELAPRDFGCNLDEECSACPVQDQCEYRELLDPE